MNVSFRPSRLHILLRFLRSRCRFAVGDLRPRPSMRLDIVLIVLKQHVRFTVSGAGSPAVVFPVSVTIWTYGGVQLKVAERIGQDELCNY